MSSSEKLSEYIQSIRFDDLPEAVILKAKNLILDSIGCILGAYKTDVGTILVGLAKQFGGKPEATIIGDGEKVSCIHAVFANSGMCNVLDYDDIYYGHGESTVIPPALAIAEKTGASGKDVITAVVLGYEIHARIGAYIHPQFLERRGKTLGLGTNQTFDAVAVASKLLKLDKEETINALGIAGSCAPVASVLKTVINPRGITMVKNNFCFAAQTGVMSALLAEQGYTGPYDILDGDTGFWRMHGVEKCNFDKITEDLGKDYRILKDGFKPYPSNGLIHPALDATIAIMKEYCPRKEDIEEIVIETNSQLGFPTYQSPDPGDLYNQEFSIPYVISAAITKPIPGLDWYKKATSADPVRRDIAHKVKVKITEEADAIYREKNTMVATVKMKVKDKVYVRSGKMPRDNPVTSQELNKKFMSLAKSVVAHPELVSEKVNHLEGLSNLNELVDLLH